MLSIISFTSKVHGQCCPYMNKISIQTPSPTANDPIQIMTQITTPSLGNKISKNHYLRNDTIFLEACYYAGLQTQPQTFLDTFNIGLLNLGKYTIYFKANQSYKSDTCKYIKFNTKIDSFTVKKAGIILTKEELSNAYIYSWHDCYHAGLIIGGLQ